MIKDRRTWDDCAKECPGMNKGKLWTRDEIQENERAYARNEPLTREQAEELMRGEG